MPTRCKYAPVSSSMTSLQPDGPLKRVASLRSRALNRRKDFSAAYLSPVPMPDEPDEPASVPDGASVEKRDVFAKPPWTGSRRLRNPVRMWSEVLLAPRTPLKPRTISGRGITSRTPVDKPDPRSLARFAPRRYNRSLAVRI